MSFSSFVFLIRFLPVALILYYLFPHKLRNGVLVVLSLIFYTWGDLKSLPALLVIAAIGYVSSLLMDRTGKGRKAIFICSLIL